MALANYSDLTTALESWTARSGIYSATDFVNFTALFEAWANRKLRVRQMEAATILTPSNGVATLPTDYLQWRRAAWNGSPRVELEYVHPALLSAYYPVTASFVPTLFSIEGTNFETRSTDTTSIDFVYWQKIPSLSSNSTNWLMTAYPDIYLAGTMVELCVFDKDTDNGAIWKARRDEMAQEINLLDKATKGPGSIRVFGPTP